MIRYAKRLVQACFKQFGYVIVPARFTQLYYQHDYGADGYERYKAVQIFHNKRKLSRVWADDVTLGYIAEYVRKAVGVVERGLCHGTRNGYEQRVLKELLGCTVVGTEISDTATQFADTIQWDFHEPKADWIGHFALIYSNSLDQAFDPRKALRTWADQLSPRGVLILEHTVFSSAAHADEMDPFGAAPAVMPYLLFEWGRDLFRLVDILRPAHQKPNYPGTDIWLFVVRRT